MKERLLMDIFKASSLERGIVLKIWDICSVLDRISDGRGGRRRILVILKEHGSMPQNKLTRILKIKPGTISEALGRMERVGLILRVPSEDDRRTVIVQLTAEGERQALEAAKEREKRNETMFSNLSNEEKETLDALLQKVIQNCKREYPDGKNK